VRSGDIFVMRQTEREREEADTELVTSITYIALIPSYFLVLSTSRVTYRYWNHSCNRVSKSHTSVLQI